MKPESVVFGMIVGVVAFFFLSLLKEPTFTQSEVNALMKFNTSEFECIETREFKEFRWSKNVLIDCTTFHNASLKVGKLVYYFPFFDGIQIELEPERQECWNESVEKYIRIDQLSETCQEFIYDQEGNIVCFKPEIRNVTKCQIIPAVTKTLTGWAENENDLVTEFCSSKTNPTL